MNRQCRWVSFVLALLMISLIALGGLAEKSFFIAGTYISTVKARNGDMTVEVMVDDSNILSVKVLDHVETLGLSDPAFERVPADIVKGQEARG